MKEHFLKNIENPDDLLADDPLTDTETVSDPLVSFAVNRPTPKKPSDLSLRP